MSREPLNVQGIDELLLKNDGGVWLEKIKIFNFIEASTGVLISKHDSSVEIKKTEWVILLKLETRGKWVCFDYEEVAQGILLELAKQKWSSSI